MICRKCLIYPAAKVFFVLDQISGLLNCWEKRNKQCSNSIFKKWAMVILKDLQKRLPKRNRLHLGERRDTRNIFLLIVSAPEEWVLRGRVQVTQQPIQNTLPRQLFSSWEIGQSLLCSGGGFSPHQKKLTFSTLYFNKFASSYNCNQQT